MANDPMYDAMLELVNSAREKTTIVNGLLELKHAVYSELEGGGLQRFMSRLDTWWERSAELNRAVLMLNPNLEFISQNGTTEEKALVKKYKADMKDLKDKLQAMRKILNGFKILNDQTPFNNEARKHSG